MKRQNCADQIISESLRPCTVPWSNTESNLAEDCTLNVQNLRKDASFRSSEPIGILCSRSKS